MYNAIVWTDTRTAGIARELKARDGSDKQDVCGLPISSYPSVTKLLWMLKNVDKVKEAYEAGNLAFGTIDAWLIYKLNGGPENPVFVSDPTNASRTMFMDIRTLKYSDEMLDFFSYEFDLRKVHMPEIVRSSDKTSFGKMGSGPLKGWSITGCLGDQSSALVGQKGFEPGSAKNTYGTGCFLLYNVGDKPVISKHGLLATVAYDFDGKPVYALEGSIAVAGSGVKFLMGMLGDQRDRYIDGYADFPLQKTSASNPNRTASPSSPSRSRTTAASSSSPPSAASSPPTGSTMPKAPSVRIYPPPPTCHPTDFHSPVGITGHTKRGHVARATLEAVCYQTKAILDSMELDSGHALTELKVDGGMSNSALCMQTQADLTQIPIIRPKMRETTALGAAIAAGFASEVWRSFEELKEVNTAGQTTFEAKMGAKESKKMFRRWEKAVKMCKGWLAEEAEEEGNGVAAKDLKDSAAKEGEEAAKL